MGGGPVSLFHIMEALKKNEDVELAFIELGGIRNGGLIGIFRFLNTVRLIFTKTAKTDIVSLHITKSAIPIIGPFIVWITRIWKCSFSIRIFGGLGYKSNGLISKKINYWVVKNADVYFAQTKSLVEKASNDGIKNVVWYPTTRPASGIKINRSKCRNFVYLGRVRTDKGIFEIIKASKKLSDNVSIDIYGPFQGNINKNIFADLKRITYKGIVPVKNVYNILSRYDALILPTYYFGEGYPGVVLEAFNIGMPVICSNWKDIGDIVDESSGIIIEPRDSKALFEAMNLLVKDDNLYLNLCDGAIKKGDCFSNERLIDQFLLSCKQIVKIIKKRLGTIKLKSPT